MENPKIRILLVAHNNVDNSGAVRAFTETVMALSSRGYFLYAIFPGKGELIDNYATYIRGNKIIEQPRWVIKNSKTLNYKGRIKLILLSIISIIKICCYILKCRPNIVVTNTLASPCGAIASKLMLKKHIWYIHEFMQKDHGVDYIFGTKKSLKLVKKYSYKIICPSYTIKEYYQGIIKTNNLYVTYQPVIVKNKKLFVEENGKKETLNLLFIGRFFESKNQLEAVKAMMFLRDENIKLKLVGALENEYTKTIETFIQENNLNDYIEINNAVEDILPVFANADIALVCSRCEAFGRVTIEALKMGLPVIASNTGANPELIKNNFNGYLYEFGVPKDLAAKILLMKDSEKRREMSKNAFAWATERFTIENYANELERILNY